MLLNARNRWFTALQKLVGVWLFANSASRHLYDVLGRIGLSASYDTVRRALRELSASALSSIRTSAVHRTFLFAYDNINRQRRVYDGELGETDVMDSGTASAFVAVEDCNPERAFDAAALQVARLRREREQLTRVAWSATKEIRQTNLRTQTQRNKETKDRTTREHVRREGQATSQRTTSERTNDE